MSTVVAPRLPVVSGTAAGQTTVTGLIQDPGGNPATGGTVTFLLSPSSSAIAFRIAGTSIFAPRAVVCQISPTGQLLNQAGTGPCLIWGNPAILPANTTYTMVIAPTVSGSPLATSTIYGVLIFGTTYDLSNIQFAPNVEVTPQQTALRADPVEANLIPITGHVFNIGSQQLPYAAIFADNINLGDQGNLDVGNLVADNISTTNLTATNFSVSQIAATDIDTGDITSTTASIPTLTATSISTTTISATTYIGLPSPANIKSSRITIAPFPASTVANVQLNWSVAFADVNYTAVCIVFDATAGNTLQVLKIVQQTAAGILVSVINNAATTITGAQLWAIAIHD